MRNICPRCGARGKIVSGKIVAAAIVGIAGLVAVYYALFNSEGISTIQNVLKSTTNEDVSVLPSGGAASRTPIATYRYCYSAIRGDLGKNGYIDTQCYEKFFAPFMREVDNDELANFKFTLPYELSDMTTIRTESSVYKYGENEFELGLYDQVGEKRYHVKLWEYPH
ncbi:hypothetical protein Ngar_c27950 [Candidatus Nitrososphaera gargensis Ga9.2]|uniref:Uncharacterized protein n=1 Tax=Nitrososphaera gargensis (strain Ga9.2) TaxID=1237085 RepID=K0IEF5_NITGG|nr:hypothetical protein [Candidatus Nitrososphaera gargensis]AFU59716.1 hypothetical protein Ngar_c27950 [Candidatus Nitrososphaera gargensis Ga9.2]